jgi:hypothetical protein
MVASFSEGMVVFRCGQPSTAVRPQMPGSGRLASGETDITVWSHQEHAGCFAERTCPLIHSVPELLEHLIETAIL